MQKSSLKKKNIPPINQAIKADKILLIDENGDKQGLHDLEEAIQMANDLSLDLVQVSPGGASPIVCKILNYGKYIFDKKKSTSASKSKTKKTT